MGRYHFWNCESLLVRHEIFGSPIWLLGNYPAAGYSARVLQALSQGDAMISSNDFQQWFLLYVRPDSADCWWKCLYVDPVIFQEGTFLARGWGRWAWEPGLKRLRLGLWLVYWRGRSLEGYDSKGTWATQTRESGLESLRKKYANKSWMVTSTRDRPRAHPSQIYASIWGLW
jgi:hypothetical protein